ncbi:MAG: type VI secretion system baseplate subunit TssG [Gammaproteobacteria bacterium]|jgi:type VI secretion system protein ImpH|nr:type VI secretion system baseplate subunit TssG [Gammaproteobacteria bacterium]MBT7306722.1 type VI secretion system baseplate subunit TssG [Gammaproteobacteria bacterium]
MEREDRQTAAAVVAALFSERHPTQFFQFVHLLESIDEGAAAVGYQGPVGKERLRFRGHASMGFPASDIEEFSLNENGRCDLSVNFIGLYGPASPLPAFYTESILQEQRGIRSGEWVELFLSREDQADDFFKGWRGRVNQEENRTIREKIQAGMVTDRVLSDHEMRRLRDGVPLNRVISSVELQALNAGELVIHCYEHPGSNLKDFLDLFHHRQISLFYRCWEKYRYYIHYRKGATDLFSQRIYALLGLWDRQMRQSGGLEWPRLLSHIGLLSMRNRSASVLAGIVSHYFNGVRSEIEEYLIRRMEIPRWQRAALGKENCTLGEDCSLGETVPDRSGKFRLILGAMNFHQFSGFLPREAGYSQLQELIRFSLRDPLEFELKLILQQAEMPRLQLGGESAARLGWSSWLGHPGSEDGEVVVVGTG